MTSYAPKIEHTFRPEILTCTIIFPVVNHYSYALKELIGEHNKAIIGLAIGLTAFCVSFPVVSEIDFNLRHFFTASSQNRKKLWIWCLALM